MMGGHRLLTIPISHYVERARWALDIAGAMYEEDGWPSVIHLLPIRWASKGRSSSVPLLITDKGVRIQDSGDILKWVARTYPDTAGHLYPPQALEEISRWESLFSKRLGPMVRVIVYHHIWRSDMQTVVFPTMTKALPPARARWFRWFVRPIRAVARQAYGVNGKSAETCTNKVRTIFEEVSKELSDGRPYLVAGSTAPTAADITFAALSAPLLGIRQYGGRLQLQIPDVEAEDWPGTELAATRAGQHAIKLYDQYRLPQAQK